MENSLLAEAISTSVACPSHTCMHAEDSLATISQIAFSETPLALPWIANNSNAFENKISPAKMANGIP